MIGCSRPTSSFKQKQDARKNVDAHESLPLIAVLRKRESRTRFDTRSSAGMSASHGGGDRPAAGGPVSPNAAVSYPPSSGSNAPPKACVHRSLSISAMPLWPPYVAYREPMHLPSSGYRCSILRALYCAGDGIITYDRGWLLFVCLFFQSPHGRGVRRA